MVMLSKAPWLLAPLTFVALVAGCTTGSAGPGAAAEARDPVEQAEVCDREQPPAAPARFEVTIDGARLAMPASGSSPVLVATAAKRPPYLVEVHGHMCGARAYFAYSVTRIVGDSDAAAIFMKLGPPPGVALSPELATLPKPTQQLDGVREVAVGETAVVGEGTWPDGQPYRISVKAL